MATQDPYVVRCMNCGTKNRVPADKMDISAKCGKCGSPLKTEDLRNTHSAAVTDGNFDTQVLKSPLPVLLDCWAPWCGPCKMVGPIMDELASEWRGRVKVCKLNVDENPIMGSKFQIRSIPTLLIFDNGRLMETLVGAVPKEQIMQTMARFL